MSHKCDFSGEVVIVTGSARGIGRAIATRVAQHGAHVVVADILREESEATAGQISAAGFAASAYFVDIGQPTSVNDLMESVLERHGRIDALVNNAGLDAPRGKAWEIDEAHWRHVIEIDLNGAWWCSRAVLPAMVKQKKGRIIFISSLAARLGSKNHSPAYATAKAGLVGLTVSLSCQVEEFGILVNAITPGPTGNTGYPTADDVKRAYVLQQPLGFGGADPIADGVLYLLGQGGNWISGSVLNISGGLFRGF
ncbi:SDR family NAD(P)-dependent oxidoreductase [Mesorhizobium sp.]|uniref:SDR family NAD(P)-dependent oxidoreductase n=1 Tax=Mesorhizobium sp. TaxID=1871066 RepID=UPI000FE74C95|nr:SDR family NAD(P)-dependent oxidoreductase [Mesorhizobium sp.]RWI88947.1 MAG: SDR family oxidoreductase [Mesorhizobium sp.]